MKPGKHQRSKQKCQDLCGTSVHKLFFFAFIHCVTCIIKTFLLVSSSVSSKQLLCFVHGKGQKRSTKTYNKELCQVS